MKKVLVQNPDLNGRIRIRLCASFCAGVSVLLIAFCPSYLLGDMIVFKNTERQPVFGLIKKQSDTNTTIDVIEDVWDRTPQLVQFSNEEIELVVRSFDAARLARLTPTNLSGYQDYAIELGSQSADPVAHNLAIRLHTIVVGNAQDSNPLQQSAKIASLRWLLKLARNDKERLAVGSLLRLESPLDAPSEAIQRSTDPKPSSKSDAVAGGQSNKRVLEVIQLIRRDELNLARGLVADQKVAELFERWKPALSASEIRRIASMDRLGTDQLRRLLSVELAIKKGQGGFTKNTVNDWQSQARETTASEFELPKLSAVNEFDPKACLYRKGQWVPPDR